MEYLDEKTAMAVDRRRRMEEERKQRIFNDKVRSKGLDLQAIDDQIREKKELKEMEEARERAIAEELQQIERQVQLLAVRHEEAKRQVALDVRAENQMLQSVRRTSTPPFGVDMDTNLSGASNMLRFAGEDAGKQERTKHQQHQIIQWNDEQAKLKSQRIKAEKDADTLYDQQTRAMHMKIAELEKEHMRAKSSVKAADRDYNKFLGEMKRDQNIHAKQEESAASQYEVQSSLHNPLLTEKGNTVSSVNANRVVPYAYKGMSPDQRRAIRDEQEHQRCEKEEAKRQQAEEERAWAAQQAAVQRSVTLREREVQREREDVNRRLQGDHMRMAKEKNERYDNMNKNVYANQVSDIFFTQFNTSSR